MEEPHHTEETNEDAGTVVTGSGALVVAAAAVSGGGANTANAVAAVHIFNNNEAVGVVAVAVAEANEDDIETDDDDNDEDANDNDATAADEEEEDEDRNAIQKLLSVVQQREDFPVRQRNKIIELAHEFVNNLGTDIKEMVTDQRTVANGYAGLDSNRDTRKEVETALRHYPETVSERGGRYDDYPIQCIATIYDRHKWRCNLMAVPFVVLFAKLAIEFNSFADEERGGLLTTLRIAGHNTLLHLVQSSHKLCGDRDYHQRVDTEFLEGLVQLRRSGLFKKEDIQQYQLVHRVCNQTEYFAEKRFQFLTNWDPSSLVQLNNYGELPLHCASTTQTLRQFQVMLDTHFQYFTKEKVICLLFQQASSNGNTPFQFACKCLHKHKTDTLVHDVLEQSLGTARFSSPTTTPSLSSASSLNLGTVLMMAARNDNNISLDGWYYCIRRQPDRMLSMLRHHVDTVSVIPLSSSSSFNNNTGTNGRNNTTNNDDDENNDDDDDDAAASQHNNTNVF